MNGMQKLVESAILEMIQEIERKDMPQVRGKDIPDILDIFDKNDIEYREGLAKCGDLKPTQEDYKPEKVKSMVDSMKSGDWEASPIFVSKDAFVLDGHHRWLAYKEAYDDNYKIPVISVDLSHEDALKVFSIGADKVSEDVIVELSNPKNIVVFPGRFQPFHLGHYYSYEALVKKFGKDNVYIATSNKIEPEKSPFNFNEKKLIISKMFGIPSNKIIQARCLVFHRIKSYKLQIYIIICRINLWVSQQRIF